MKTSRRLFFSKLREFSEKLPDLVRPFFCRMGLGNPSAFRRPTQQKNNHALVFINFFHRARVKLLVKLILLSAVALQPSYAMLDLELTRGVAAAIPVAIQAFSSQPDTSLVSQVISDDLQHSGEFRVVNSADKQQSGSPLDLSQWRAKGADYVVTGSVVRVHGGRYEVHVQLRSAFDPSNTSTTTDDVKQDSLLLDETFTASLPAMRALAHGISDDIYHKLTGTSGIFSTKIAYIVVQEDHLKARSYRLEVADADGFGAQTLLKSDQPIMSPAWSPDGKSLAYVSFEGHRAAVYLQTLATGDRVIVSKLEGINGAPAFSPNGTRIALVLSKNGNPNIYLMDLASKKLQAVTSGWAIDTEPAFSTDGSSLLFTSNRDGSPQIYQYSLLTDAVSRLTYDGNYNARASYTSDGQFIVMMHRDENGFGIARLDLNSGSIKILTQTDGDESPSVAPNGKMVIYATQYGGRGVLAQVSIDGKIKLRLPAREGTVQEPAWSPFITR